VLTVADEPSKSRLPLLGIGLGSAAVAIATWNSYDQSHTGRALVGTGILVIVVLAGLIALLRRNQTR
jgi:uncharacterized membrane protein